MHPQVVQCFDKAGFLFPILQDLKHICTFAHSAHITTRTISNLVYSEVYFNTFERIINRRDKRVSNIFISSGTVIYTGAPMHLVRESYVYQAGKVWWTSCRYGQVSTWPDIDFCNAVSQWLFMQDII